MREIKFRVWDNQRGCWAKESDARQRTGFEFGINDYWLEENGADKCIRWSFMQYTGSTEWKHLDGKEIWESDIIKNIDTGDLQVVFWNEDKAAWYCRYIQDESRTLTLNESLGNMNDVIGNIYDNPEILKKQ